MSSSQTFRLIAFSMLLGIPGTIWVVGIYQELALGTSPLPNWATIHKHYDTVSFIRASKLSSQHRNSLVIRWWSVLAEAYIFILLFVTSRDVLLEYRRLWVCFKTTVLRHPLPQSKNMAKPDLSPEYAPYNLFYFINSFPLSSVSTGTLPSILSDPEHSPVAPDSPLRDIKIR
jgi:hypothetical protein